MKELVIIGSVVAFGVIVVAILTTTPEYKESLKSEQSKYEEQYNDVFWDIYREYNTTKVINIKGISNVQSDFKICHFDSGFYGNSGQNCKDFSIRIPLEASTTFEREEP